MIKYTSVDRKEFLKHSAGVAALFACISFGVLSLPVHAMSTQPHEQVGLEKKQKSDQQVEFTTITKESAMSIDYFRGKSPAIKLFSSYFIIQDEGEFNSLFIVNGGVKLPKIDFSKQMGFVYSVVKEQRVKVEVDSISKTKDGLELRVSEDVIGGQATEGINIYPTIANHLISIPKTNEPIRIIVNGKYINTISYRPWPKGGEIVEDLQVIVKSVKDTYKVGENIALWLRLRNLGNKGRVIIYNNAYVNYVGAGLSLDILDNRNNEIFYEGPRIAAMIGPKPKYFVLKKESSLTYHIELLSQWFSPELTEGKYKFTIYLNSATKDFYNNPQNYEGTPIKRTWEKLPVGIPILSGTVKSNTIQFEVVK